MAAITGFQTSAHDSTHPQVRLRFMLFYKGEHFADIGTGAESLAA